MIAADTRLVRATRRHPQISLAVALVVVGSLAVFLMYDDYGITWDESVQATYGDLVLDYFRSGFRDRRCNEFQNLRLYGPLVETACALIYQTLGADKFAVRHLGIGLVAVLTLPALVVFTASLRRGPVLGLVAALGLITLPRFVGHAFNNSKDIPFACAFAWGMAAMAALLSAETRTWRHYLGCGAALGLCMAVRIGGVLLLAFLFAGTFYVLWTRHRGRAPAVVASAPARTWAQAGTMLGVAWLITIAFWPWAHESPLGHPLEAFVAATDFSQVYTVMFAGEVYKSDALPWYYLVWFLGITTPLPMLALASVGAIVTAGTLVRRPGEHANVVRVLLLLWLFFPIAYQIVTRPNVYNGLRHFLFILPALAVLAGIGALAVLERVRVRYRTPVLGALLLLVVWPVTHLVRLHPYQMTYYNLLVGGTGGAWQDYGADYWATSYKEGFAWLRAQRRPGETTVIVVAANRYLLDVVENYADPGMELHALWGLDPLPARFDYYIGLTHLGIHNHRSIAHLPVVHVVGRAGASYAVIRAGPR